MVPPGDVCVKSGRSARFDLSTSLHWFPRTRRLKRQCRYTSTVAGGPRGICECREVDTSVCTRASGRKSCKLHLERFPPMLRGCFGKGHLVGPAPAGLSPRQPRAIVSPSASRGKRVNSDHPGILETARIGGSPLNPRAWWEGWKGERNITHAQQRPCSWPPGWPRPLPKPHFRST
jgi:hypothetical protein